MANQSNLIPQAHVLTVEEASKGGIASGKARRKRKQIAETLNILLSQKVKEPKAKKKLKELGVPDKDQDMQMLLIISEYNRALNGDKDSRDFILKSLGEFVSDEDNTNNSDGVIIVDDCEYIDEENLSE